MVRDEEINFNNLSCQESLDTNLSVIEYKLSGFKNSYIGNKRKLIYKLVKTINKYNIKYNSFLDLFSGSAYVSMAMKMLDKRVISNDILLSSYLNAVAFVKNKNIRLTNDEKKYLVNNLNKYNPLSSSHVFFMSLKKFTHSEIGVIGNYYENAKTLFGSFFNSFKKSEENLIKYALAVVALQNYIIERCFIGGRLNNGQILANVDYRIKHQRDKRQEMLFETILYREPLYHNDKNNHECYNKGSIELLEQNKFNIDLCYIDPPYGGDQSDYLKAYSFFEECLREDLYLNIKKNKQFNNFTNNKDYEAHFNKLIKLTDGIPWIIVSYNDTSWGSIDKITEIIKKYRKKVIIESFSYSYKYRNQNNNTKETKEYLILCE